MPSPDPTDLKSLPVPDASEKIQWYELDVTFGIHGKLTPERASQLQDDMRALIRDVDPGDVLIDEEKLNPRFAMNRAQRRAQAKRR